MNSRNGIEGMEVSISEQFKKDFVGPISLYKFQDHWQKKHPLFLHRCIRKRFTSLLTKETFRAGDARCTDDDFVDPPRLYFHFMCRSTVGSKSTGKNQKAKATSMEEYESHVQKSRWLRCPFCDFTAFSAAARGNLTLVAPDSRKRKAAQIGSAAAPARVSEGFDWSPETSIGVAALLGHLSACHEHFSFDSVVCSDSLSLHIAVRRKANARATKAPRAVGSFSMELERTGGGSSESRVKAESPGGALASAGSGPAASNGSRADPICLSEDGSVDAAEPDAPSENSGEYAGAFEGEIIFLRPRKKRKVGASGPQSSNVLNGAIRAAIGDVLQWPVEVKRMSADGSEGSSAGANSGRWTGKNSNGAENSLFNSDGTLRIELLSTSAIERSCFSDCLKSGQKLGKQYFHRCGLPYDRREDLNEIARINAVLKIESRKNRKAPGSIAAVKREVDCSSSGPKPGERSAEDRQKPPNGAADGGALPMLHSYDSEDDDPSAGFAQAVVSDSQLSEFSDVMEEEKILMSLWNMHVRTFPPYADGYFPFVLEVFARRYAPVIVAKQLRFTFLVFLMYLWGVSMVKAEQVQVLLGIVDDVQLSVLEEGSDEKHKASPAAVAGGSIRANTSSGTASDGECTVVSTGNSSRTNGSAEQSSPRSALAPASTIKAFVVDLLSAK